MAQSAMILGAAGPVLSDDERAFYRDSAPWGFILFKRNIGSPDEVRSLTDALREAAGHDAPVFIDQEGGRVQRMGPPHWPKYPAGRTYGLLSSNDPLMRRTLARLGARLMALDLLSVGINADCLPVLDVPVPGANDVIGDRAYTVDPAEVAILGRAAAEGLLAGGVLPVMKHIPGHGRSMVDSHLALPTVQATREELQARDFLPFRMLSDMPAAMTAHVVYTAFDTHAPATTSRKVLRHIVRGEIGYDGLLMSDDLSMKALSGTLGERASAALSAGCDLALHCNGILAEMQDVAKSVPTLSGKARRRAEAALSRIRHLPEPLDVAESRARFEEALASLTG